MGWLGTGLGWMLGGPIGGSIGAQFDASGAQNDAANAAANATTQATKDSIAAQNAALERLIGLNQPFYNAGLSGLDQLKSAALGQPVADSRYVQDKNTPLYALSPSPRYGGLTTRQIMQMVTGELPNPNGYTIADALAAGQEVAPGAATGYAYRGPNGEMVTTQPTVTANLPNQVTAADIPQLSNFTPTTLDVNDPEYKYRMSQGNISLGRSLAARGLQGGGTAPLALAQLQDSIGADQWGRQYSRGMDAYNAAIKGYGLKTDLGNTAYSRLAGLVGLGTGAGNTIGQGVTGNANNLSSLYSELGTNQANNALYKGQNEASLYSGLGQLPLQLGSLAIMGKGAKMF